MLVGVIRCNIANMLFIWVLTFVHSVLCTRICTYGIWLVLRKTFSLTSISKIAFRTTNSVHSILHTRMNGSIAHHQSGIYQMKCHTCQRSYIEQTEWKLQLRYQDYIPYITSNNPHSIYIYFSNVHESGPVETIMTRLTH